MATGNVSESEDIPSDFFDDFTKDEFMDGLSVIDSWDDSDGTKQPGPRARIDADAIDSVKDLRELIGDGRDGKMEDSSGRCSVLIHNNNSNEMVASDQLNKYIKPGSRRDPNKTIEAIKKDKEEKVKEYLAKQIESNGDLKPPGTELDDFFNEEKSKAKAAKKPNVFVAAKSAASRQRSSSKERRRRSRVSPMGLDKRPSPGPFRPKYKRYSPFRQYRRSPLRLEGSPRRRRGINESPRRRSPHRRSPLWRSPARRGSPRRSPARSPRRRRSRSRSRRRSARRSHSRSRSRSLSSEHRDKFSYPATLSEQDPPKFSPNRFQMDQFMSPTPSNFPGNAAGYPYPPGPTFPSYPDPYGYSGPAVPPYVPPAPQPLPPAPLPVPPPSMIPLQTPIVPPMPSNNVPHMKNSTPNNTPHDALAQLVAEGKISQEDYLKLAPNKGVPSPIDTKKRVLVLNRCSLALNKLTSLFLPNRLLINNALVGPEPKSIAPKYVSPLKRQAEVEFHFTKQNGSASASRNKQLIDSIIGTMGLDQLVSKPKRKVPPKNMKDVAVQTTKPHCEVCEIRENTKTYNASTSIDREHLTTSIHTQVVEHDLMKSKSMFNPTGGISDGAPISIAHLTPAQLVSQLAARAKTLKQDTPMNQYERRSNYDYDSRGGGSGDHYNYNYRY